MTINGSGFSDVKEIVFPGDVKVTDFTVVTNDMIRVVAPSGIASEGGNIVVRTESGEEAVSPMVLTLGGTVISGYSVVEGDEVEGGTAITIYGTDLDFVSRIEIKDKEFFDRSTELMLYTIGVAISQIGNNDEIGKFSAKSIADGSVLIGIKNGPAVEIICKDNRLVTIKKAPEKYRSAMIFESIETARALFDGKVSALACIGTSRIEMHGLVSMLDNINRILDRVALYLA